MEAYILYQCSCRALWSFIILLQINVVGIVDPEYLEFLEFIAKPVENLPSAEIQLERRDAERAG